MARDEGGEEGFSPSSMTTSSRQEADLVLLCSHPWGQLTHAPPSGSTLLCCPGERQGQLSQVWWLMRGSASSSQWPQGQSRPRTLSLVVTRAWDITTDPSCRRNTDSDMVPSRGIDPDMPWSQVATQDNQISMALRYPHGLWCQPRPQASGGNLSNRP